MGIGFMTTDAEYSSLDLVTVASCSILNCIGTTGLSLALQSGGRGGPIYSINSLQTLIPLFMNTLIKGLYPTQLQNLGIVLGFAGAVITARI
jgi:hypothetical protein